MVCDSCGTVIEAHLCHIPDDLARRAAQEGFSLNRWDAELHGTCRSCTK
jgi:Fe2+ or Zn2+ uptake regulation protein